jgi:O-antigen/teichoic acid export membrane protein
MDYMAQESLEPSSAAWELGTPNVPQSAPGRLTSGRLLARNALWNMSGYLLPLLIAVPTTPLLVHSLGADRFGVLALAWVVLGYLTFFDLGLGRALTQQLAHRLAGEEGIGLPSSVWTAITLMLGIGIVLMAGALLVAPVLVHSVLKVPMKLRDETLGAFYLLALSIPMIITSIGLRSVLEAQQRFFLINAVRLPMGVFMFLGPVLVLPFSHDIRVVVLALVLSRVLTWLAQFALCLRVMPSLGRGLELNKGAIMPLVRFGSWTTVTNIVSPLMVYMDRFLIGSIVSLAGVAYYATPYEVVTKLSLIAGAVTGVLFPAFASTFVREPTRTRLLFGKGIKYVFLALFPLTLLILAFAHEAMGLWLGPEFAARSAPVLQLLAIGVFANALAQMPFTLLQGIGRPDLTAKLHLVELPFYCVGLWWAVSTWGLLGAALAWSLRVGIDALGLFVLSQRFVPIQRLFSRGIASCVVYAVIAIGSLMVTGGVTKLVLASLVLIAYGLITWFLLLAGEERSLLGSILRRPTAVPKREGVLQSLD